MFEGQHHLVFCNFELIDFLLFSNPMGRTGIRGKGVLWRWGPNHVIKAVVTRWRRKYTADLLPTASYLYVEGKRVLEFITVPKNEFSEGLSEVNYGLPGVSKCDITVKFVNFGKPEIFAVIYLKLP